MFGYTTNINLFPSSPPPCLQVELKESDRSLLEIFKQLQGDVAELREMCVDSPRRVHSTSGYHHRSSTGSYSELDSRVRPNPVMEKTTIESSQELEATLTSSSEQSPVQELVDEVFHLKPSESNHGSDSLLGVPAEDSPSSAAKVLEGSASLPKITNSPGGSSSNISRDSSIDSGIQFASEPDTNNVVSSNSNVDSSNVVRLEAASDPKAGEGEEGEGLGSLAEDIFSMLGASNWMASS